ncbi:related to ankyrin repeat protein [Rhynchosporium secalis]|uniref:Related to ankyrin repeat protein n=1 Tax=Rhynchosporium secalis TaxID=38038 RepID=A0A1E1MS83_RHYSE|nr:related to ankyrin repeat protein [Rhynchosporium secalis]
MAETGEQLSRSRSRSSDHHERLEPQLLRAAENDDVEKLREIIEAARTRRQLTENFLRIGLVRSSEKGKVSATEYLLTQGAQPDGATGNRLSPLFKAVERNNIGIVHLLLEHGANPETADKKGRTALMTAAWMNFWHILNSLIVRGADINAKDGRGRNVLHNLGADKQCNWGDSVIELLLKENIYIDGVEGQDQLGRSPLHWACATGKTHLAELLLTRPRLPRANVHAVEFRGKTSLHLAAAHDWIDIVELLLENGADISAKSDGGWTPLHNACEFGFEKVVRTLVEAGSDVNAKLLTGITPLHLAAQRGHLGVVKYLLEQKDIKKAARDTFGSTPFLRAAQNRHKDIVNLLAPFNHMDGISEDALGASNGFNATVVDFGNFHNENRVKRPTVYGIVLVEVGLVIADGDVELLYGRDPVNSRKPKYTILPIDDKASDFRWIHLPANNMAWIEVLLTKMFIEEGASDVEGFKALEKSFSHHHRGQQSHSHFMRPLCQSSTRAARISKLPVEPTVDPGAPKIVINGADAKGSPKPASRNSTFREDSNGFSKSLNGKDHDKGAHKDKGKKPHTKGNKSPKLNDTPSKDKDTPRKPSQSLDRPSTPGRNETPLQAKGNVFTFMPYLHFESTRRRQEMQQAIKRAEKMRSPLCPYLGKAQTYDEMLIRAHLATSNVSLHVRRTLDQFFYHNIDTESRDQDQVVYRYQLKGKEHEDPDLDPKIVMVDQLWMWVLGKDLIVTSFPQRWQQPKNDPLNVLDSVIEDINSKTREPVKSVYDLAMIITGRCTGVFDRHRMGDDEYQFLDMFESSIGSATDRETILFKEFNAASAQASIWLQHHRKSHGFSRFIEHGTTEAEIKHETNYMQWDAEEEKFKMEELMRNPPFIDKLLDIGQETDLLAETKDIRDELNMIAKVLDDQKNVLPDLQEAVCDIYRDEQKSQTEVKKRFREQLKTIEMHLKDIERMDRQAERIYKSITDMLDLKQKHANAFEARFARDQAAGTARQSQTIMVFTIVTIIFLPLSFIAAFFAINIREFPRSESGTSLPLSWVSKYMFGIGFAVSIPLIAIALSLDDIGHLFRRVRRTLTQRRLKKERASQPGDGSLDTLTFAQALSVARSTRKSIETEWIRERFSTSTRPPPVVRPEIRQTATGFKMTRTSGDLERGTQVRDLAVSKA